MKTEDAIRKHSSLEIRNLEFLPRSLVSFKKWTAVNSLIKWRLGLSHRRKSQAIALKVFSFSLTADSLDVQILWSGPGHFNQKL